MEEILRLPLDPPRVKEVFEASGKEFIRLYKNRLNQLLAIGFLFLTLSVLSYLSSGDWILFGTGNALLCLAFLGFYVYDTYSFRTKLTTRRKELEEFYQKYEGVKEILFVYNERGIKQIVEDKTIRSIAWEEIHSYRLWENGIILFDRQKISRIRIPAKLAAEEEYQRMETFFKNKVREYSIRKKA